MKRISSAAVTFAIMTFAFTFNWAVAGHAAEIPPTAECSAMMKTELFEYEKKFARGLTDREERQAERAYVENLVAAGCLTASEPILKSLPPRPNTPECAVSADSAGEFWTPQRRALNSIFKEMKRTVGIPRRRLNADFRRRIARLERQGASAGRVKRLFRRRAAANRRLDRKAIALDRRLEKTVAVHSYATLLTLYELLAQRCVGMGTLGALFNGDDQIPDTPGAQVLAENRLLVFISVIFASLDAMNQGGEHAGQPEASTAGRPLALPTDVSTTIDRSDRSAIPGL